MNHISLATLRFSLNNFHSLSLCFSLPPNTEIGNSNSQSQNPFVTCHHLSKRSNLFGVYTRPNKFQIKIFFFSIHLIFTKWMLLCMSACICVVGFTLEFWMLLIFTCLTSVRQNVSMGVGLRWIVLVNLKTKVGLAFSLNWKMYGRKACQLVKDLASGEKGQLTPYNVSLRTWF